VKNRMREICTSGTVRGGGGNILTYSELKPSPHLPLKYHRADFATGLVQEPELWGKHTHDRLRICSAMVRE